MQYVVSQRLIQAFKRSKIKTAIALFLSTVIILSIIIIVPSIIRDRIYNKAKKIAEDNQCILEIDHPSISKIFLKIIALLNIAICNIKSKKKAIHSRNNS